MKKELARCFGDKRMIISLILPGLTLFIIYSFIGSAYMRVLSMNNEHIPQIYSVNLPQSLNPVVEQLGLKVLTIREEEIANIKENISNNEADLCLVFPPDFDDSVSTYDVKSGLAAPVIAVYFNSADDYSNNVYNFVMGMLDDYESAMSNKFDINMGIADADQATSEDHAARFISLLMPILLLTFMCSGIISLTPESIAGEKERGTIAALLVTPMKRSHLAAGKILSLGILSFICGLSSLLGVVLSIPKLMRGEPEIISSGIGYGAVDYLLLALTIFSTLLMLTALFSIVSAFAKSVKEAGLALSPFIIVVMAVGISGVFGHNDAATVKNYLIPLYNSVQSMNGIFSHNYSMTNVAVACVANLVYACVGGFILTLMFNSEKIMFSK